DAESLLPRRGSVLLHHRSPFLCKRIADGGVECGGVDFDLVASPARRIIVAFAAAGRVEQGTEPRLGCEHAVEHDLSPVEAIALRARPPAQGITGLHRLLATHGRAPEGQDNPKAGPRAPTSSLPTL